MNKLEAVASTENNGIPNALVSRVDDLPHLGFSEVSQLKKDIEHELERQFDLLSLNNVDLNTPLITAEGFPRDDLDLVTIRLIKRNVNVLRNDLRRVIERLEYLLPLEFESLQRQNSAVQKLEALDTSLVDDDSLLAFAKVVDVKIGSPSHEAGLQSDDLIVKFGTIHALNHNNLYNVGKLVQQQLNKEISLRVKRDDEIITIQLVPRPWQGAGLLGCRIIRI